MIGSVFFLFLWLDGPIGVDTVSDLWDIAGHSGGVYREVSLIGSRRPFSIAKIRLVKPCQIWSHVRHQPPQATIPVSGVVGIIAPSAQKCPKVLVRPSILLQDASVH